MKSATAFILMGLISFQCFGQTSAFYKTTKKRQLYYIEMTQSFIKVYKMGRYTDPAGGGPAILSVDTLYATNENKFAGRTCSFLQVDGTYVLHTEKGKTLPVIQVDGVNQNFTELNNAYYLKSYFDMSERINREFPLYHYSFRGGFYSWDTMTHKSINPVEFRKRTDHELELVHDSIRRTQTKLSNTAEFIKENSNRSDYSELKDSLRTLPVEYRYQSRYFERSVYYLSKADPENFYKILEDFPGHKTIIYFAVDDDKDLKDELKEVQGYDSLKQEYLKAQRQDRTFTYTSIGMYALLGLLVGFAIIL